MSAVVLQRDVLESFSELSHPGVCSLIDLRRGTALFKASGTPLMQHCQVPKFPERKQVFRGHRLSQPTGGKVDSRMERPKKGHMEVLKNPRESG